MIKRLRYNYVERPIIPSRLWRIRALTFLTVKVCRFEGCRYEYASPEEKPSGYFEPTFSQFEVQKNIALDNLGSLMVWWP